MAREHVSWFTPWKKVLDWKPPFAKWFVGGKLNVSYNCLDRHLEGKHAWRRNKAAIIWEGEPGDTRVLTYGELHREVCRFANVLLAHGVAKGDRVAIYLPMIPELAIAMLACARIGAPHSVVFGGFSAEALRDRINDAGAKLVVTADGGYRRGAASPLKPAVDEALEGAPCVEKVICVQAHRLAGRDARGARRLVARRDARTPAPTARPRSSTASTRSSSSTPAAPPASRRACCTPPAATSPTSRPPPRRSSTSRTRTPIWCTADLGWVTGHSYVVYGILANGATTLMYEGVPTHPRPDRFWEIIERHRVTIFYTAPTAIRTFIRLGDEHPKRHDLSSLRLLGTVGEPINPEAWIWYHRVIGGKRCPIVDTWWQTETGGIMITPLPGRASPTKPGSATLPFPGIDAAVFDRRRQDRRARATAASWCSRRPWPGMLRGIWGDPERYQEQYWSRFAKTYFAGDGAHRDKDGYFWIMGRIDDVMNVSGHRIGTMEVESALVAHERVAEAAVVGRPDDLTGTAIVAFVTPEAGHAGRTRASRTRCASHVAKQIGAIAKPADIRFTDALPKTRSGKIMRRLLRDIASGSKTVGDTTTLEDFSVIAKLQEHREEA